MPATAFGRAKRRAGVRLLHARARGHAFGAHYDWNARTHRSLPPADLYLLHGYSQYPGVSSAAMRRHVPFAYDAHDVYFELRPDQDFLWQGTWEKLERRCARSAAAFSTVSDGVAEVLEHRMGRRPVTIRNCHDLRVDRAVENGIRERTGVAADDFLLVSIGNDKDGMAVEQALEAVASLPERFHVAFVGRGYEGHAERAGELGIAERVHLIGAVAPSEVVSLVSGADAAAVLYLPLTRSYANALPNGFFQAIGAGLPVLYSPRLGEVAAIAERHGLGITIEPDDPASIAAAMRRLGEDPAERERLAAAAREAGETESWEREEQRFSDYIESALA